MKTCFSVCLQKCLETDLISIIRIEHDYTDIECNFLLEEYNVKINQIDNGFISFYGSKLGQSGLGNTRVLAFAMMIKNLGYRRKYEIDFEEDLKTFFEILSH